MENWVHNYWTFLANANEKNKGLQISSLIKHLGIIESWFYNYSRQGYHEFLFSFLEYY